MATSYDVRSKADTTTLSSPTAALLTSAWGEIELIDALTGLLDEAGWTVERIAQDRLWATEREPWDVIVIPAGRITEDILLLVARATRFPTTRVALVSPDRNPHHIADVLRSGVDDYMVVPFLPRECLARLSSLALHARSIRNRHAVTRREVHGTPAARLNLDPATRSVRAGAARVALSTREWDVLSALLAAGEAMVSAAELASSIWGTTGDEARVVSTISRLRRKLTGAGVRTLDVVSVRGLGYAARLVE